MTELETYRKQVDKKLADFRLASQVASTAKRAYIKAENELTDVKQAQQVIAEVSQSLQQQAHQQISAIATKCLQTIFQENSYQLIVNFEQKRGKTEAKITLEKNGFVVNDPLGEVGGGITDIVGFSLRLAALCMQRPPLRRVLILDEPFKAVRGKHYRARVRSLLLTLAKELGVQFICCVDHVAYPEFMVGKVVEVG